LARRHGVGFQAITRAADEYVVFRSLNGLAGLGPCAAVP